MTDAAKTPTEKPTVEKPIVDPAKEIESRLASLTAVAEPVAVDPAAEARKQIAATINQRVADFTVDLQAELGQNFGLVEPAVAAKGLASLDQARKHFVKSVGTIDEANLGI